ncbi:MAG TPA: hypothetical protein VIK33_18185 [Anaerolineae bacterium]
MTLPSTITIEELPLIFILSLPIIYWGYRNGLDAVIIAVIGVLFGMIFADTLGGAVVSAVNTFWKLINAILSAGVGPDMFAKLNETPGLIETPEQARLLGTIIFALTSYVAFKIAMRRAGGRSNILEGIFGAVGGAVTGYMILTFVIQRHVELPQVVQITETTQLPVFNIDANIVVLIALVIIVYAVQSTRAKKK